MTLEQGALVERLRTLLADESVTREVPMFGARSFMVNDKMLVSALKGGGLLVRVDADRHEALLTESDATQAEMGAGRDMGPGWIEVDSEAISDDERLTFWLGVAMEHNRVMTGGDA